MDTNGNAGKQRDKPGLLYRLRLFLALWATDILLLSGAALVSIGASMIYPPAGVIAAGVLLIVGGVLWAKGGDGP